ncbi:MAG: TetR-like C-terminal domain-containing protein [bacterium]|nr:TetR-like C-terminal domain-containing protein [bacterium]
MSETCDLMNLAEPRIDPRKRRTRAMLREALMALILETGDYDSLTIDRITTRADLRRATFYLHYAQVDELLLDALQHHFDALARQVEPLAAGDGLGGKTHVEAFRVTFQHAADHRALYRVLFASARATVVTRRVRDTIAGFILTGIGTLPPGTLTVPADVLAQALAGAEVSLIAWWLESESPYTPAEMATYAHRILLDGVRAAASLNG